MYNEQLLKDATALMTPQTWNTVKGYIREVVIPTINSKEKIDVYTALENEFKIWDGQKAHWIRFKEVDCTSPHNYYMFLAHCGEKWEKYGKDATMKSSSI